MDNEELSFTACLLVNGLPNSLNESRGLHILVTDTEYACKCHKWHMATGAYQGDWWANYKQWLVNKGGERHG